MRREEDAEGAAGRIVLALPEADGTEGPRRPGAEPGLQVLTTALTRVMDALPAELVLCTPAGSILHATHTARAWLDAGDGRRSIGEEIRYLCVALHLRITEDAGPDETEAVAQAERWVMLDGTEMHLRAVDLGIPRQGRSPAILILLDAQDPLSDQKLRQLGLTRAESQVARLVVRGRTNRDIAVALKVSIHTVRHHVQHIFDKVGVRSRTRLIDSLSRHRNEIAAP